VNESVDARGDAIVESPIGTNTHRFYMTHSFFAEIFGHGLRQELRDSAFIEAFPNDGRIRRKNVRLLL